MKKIMLLSILTALMFPGCGVRKNTSGDNRKADFDIAVNDRFNVELRSNPTTGYHWKWANRNDIAIVDSAGYQYLPDKPVLTGSGGKEVWTFKGVKSGTDTIKLEYCRSWEPNSTVETRTIVVRVR